MNLLCKFLCVNVESKVAECVKWMRSSSDCTLPVLSLLNGVLQPFCRNYSLHLRVYVLKTHPVETSWFHYLCLLRSGEGSCSEPLVQCLCEELSLDLIFQTWRQKISDVMSTQPRAAEAGTCISETAVKEIIITARLLFLNCSEIFIKVLECMSY